MHQRLHGLDFLRALMMMLGIVLHGAQMYMTMYLAFDYYRDPMSSPIMDGILIYINTFRMPVFFFLSGFFTALLFQRYQLVGMLKNRLLRLALPFIIFLPPLAIILDLQWISATQLMVTGELGLNTSYLRYLDLLWDNTHHLWFLYFLMIVLVFVIAVLWLYALLPSSLKRALAGFASQLPASSVLLIVLFGLGIGAMAIDDYSGRINGGIRFAPYWNGVLYFGSCFTMGWCVWYRQECLKVFEQRCWLYLAVAHIFLTIGLVAFFTQGSRDALHYPVVHATLAIANGLSVSFFIVAFTGIFGRYFSEFSPRVRYVSDSAYWVFLLHQPVLLLLAVPMFNWQISAVFKFVIVCAGTFLLCMVSYHYLVRSTSVGALLNGRRYSRALPVA